MLNPSLWHATVEIHDLLQLPSISNCIIGGVADNRRGEPHATVGVDATMSVSFGNKRSVTKSTLETFRSRVDDPLEFAFRARKVWATIQDRINLALSLSGLPYEERVFQHSSLWEIIGLRPIRNGRADGLIVLKAFGDRPQDWIDIERIFFRKSKKLDAHLMMKELEPLMIL